MRCKCFCLSLNCNESLNFVRRHSTRRRNRKIILLLVGLDNAGKTSTVLRLADEPIDRVVPSMGFSLFTLKCYGYPVVIHDLGGSPQIRDIWPQYFADAHGIIYVVDSSDWQRIEESRKCLEDLLTHNQLAGKPLLLLGNKQDKENAMDEIDLEQKLRLEQLVNRQRCSTLVELYSATGPRIDPCLLNGYRWLVMRVIKDYDMLNSRVERDCAQMRAMAEAVRQKRLRNQDKEQQTESLPSDNNLECDPFRPIHSLLQTESTSVATPSTANGHVVPLTPLSVQDQDSPDSSSHSVAESESQIYIPLHSPPSTSPLHSPATSSTRSSQHGSSATTASPPHAPEPDNPVVAESVNPETSVKTTNDVRKKKGSCEQRKLRKYIVRRCNRTAPLSACSDEGRLPPLHTPPSWARPSSSKSLPSQGWGLSLALEEVEPYPSELSVLQAPVELTLSASDDDADVVCPSLINATK